MLSKFDVFKITETSSSPSNKVCKWWDDYTLLKDDHLRIGSTINFPHITKLISLNKYYAFSSKLMEIRNDELFKFKPHICSDLSDTILSSSRNCLTCNPKNLGQLRKYCSNHVTNDHDPLSTDLSLCIYKKIHICTESLCRSTYKSKNGSIITCQISNKNYNVYSCYDRANENFHDKTEVTGGNTQQLIKSTSYCKFDKNDNFINCGEEFRDWCNFKPNDFSFIELENCLKSSLKILNDDIKNGYYYKRNTEKFAKGRFSKKRKKKTYNHSIIKRKKNDPILKKHNLGFNQPQSSSSSSLSSSSTSTPSSISPSAVGNDKLSKNDKNNFKKCFALTRKVVAFIARFDENKINEKNLDHWLYMRFLTKTPYREMINIRNQSSILKISNQHYLKNIFQNNNEIYRLSIISIEIIKKLCPGPYRLCIETPNILTICRKSYRSLISREKLNFSKGIVSEYCFMLEKSTFNDKRYKLILDETISDQRVLEITEIIIWFWKVCKRSPYLNGNKNAECLNMTNHCIAMIYLLSEGYKYSMHTMIPQIPFLTRVGYLLPKNSLNDYGMKRYFQNVGQNLILKCITEYCELYLPESIKPFGKLSKIPEFNIIKKN